MYSIIIYTPRGLKPHPLRVICFMLGLKSPLQNLITNYELRITNCLTLLFCLSGNVFTSVFLSIFNKFIVIHKNLYIQNHP